MCRESKKVLNLCDLQRIVSEDPPLLDGGKHNLYVAFDDSTEFWFFTG